MEEMNGDRLVKRVFKEKVTGSRPRGIKHWNDK